VKRVSSTALASSAVFSVFRERWVLDDGMEVTRDVVRHPGAVAVVAETNEGGEPELLLVRQFRFPVQKALLEIPAGLQEPGENPEECARRELLEETGYEPVTLELLARVLTSPGFVNEEMWIYYARVRRAKTPAERDEGEGVSLVRVTRSEALRLVEEGTIRDGKTVLGLILAYGTRGRAHAREDGGAADGET
jgi:ADP-ribose pyrophosphatase